MLVERCESTLKELMAARGRDLYVLADHTKLEASPFAFIATMPTPWTLITDERVPDEVVRRFETLAEASVIRAPYLPARGRG